MKLLLKLILFPFFIIIWIVKDNQKLEKQELDEFLSYPPTLSELPVGYEIKGWKRKRDCWQLSYGETGTWGASGSYEIMPRTRSIFIAGHNIQIN